MNQVTFTINWTTYFTVKTWLHSSRYQAFQYHTEWWYLSHTNSPTKWSPKSAIHSHRLSVGQLRSLHMPLGKERSFPILIWGEVFPAVSYLLLSSKASPPSLWPPECFLPKHNFILRSAITNSQLLHVFFSSNGTNCGRESLCATSHWGNETVQFPSWEGKKKYPFLPLFLLVSFLLVSITWCLLVHLDSCFFFFFLVGW